MSTTADTLTDAKLESLPTGLARARACTPLTIRDVATAVGIGYGMLSEYEQGAKLPRQATRQRLADFYGVDVGELFTMTAHTPRRATEPANMTTAMGERTTDAQRPDLEANR